MMVKQWLGRLSGMAVIICTAMLLTDASAVRQAAAAGMYLAAGNVIPSLFAFSVAADLLVHLDGLRPVERLLSPLYRYGFRVRPAAAAAFLIGTAGGYPLGAQTVSTLYENGRLTKQEAEYALGFSNNCGIAYIVSVVAPQLALTPSQTVRLYAIHLASAWMTAFLLRPFALRAAPVPAAEHRHSIQTVQSSFAVLLTEAVGHAALAMLKLCGWISLFSIVSAVLHRVSGTAGWLSGVLELSAGIAGLRPGELLKAACFLGFGGLCVACQASSFAVPNGLRMRWYFAGKTLQAILSALLVMLLL